MLDLRFVQRRVWRNNRRSKLDQRSSDGLNPFDGALNLICTRLTVLALFCQSLLLSLAGRVALPVFEPFIIAQLCAEEFLVS